MDDYDDAIIQTAAEAYGEALAHLEVSRIGVPITQHAANLAAAIGITAVLARGETSRVPMVLSALKHISVAYDDHVNGIDSRRLPQTRTTQHYADHAEVLRAMAAHAQSDECRAALEQCATAYDRIARSGEALGAASLLVLCRHTDKTMQSASAFHGP
jgi:hypothetical protein